MANPSARTGLRLVSLVKPEGILEVSLQRITVADPGPGEVLIRIDAAPINPSDMGLLFGPADLASARFSGTAEEPVLTAKIPERAMTGIAGRVGAALGVGNEGAGVVIAAGSSAGAQALLGKTVAVLGGGMYAQLRLIPVEACLALPDGTAAADAASAFVNPLTALGMVETMRLESHKALVHTAAASNLGQMLVRLCKKDGVPLVNIVRKAEQVALLRDLGAEHVIDSSAASFADDLVAALDATGATIAFDAIGGGRLASQILTAMETVAARKLEHYSRYGSNTLKQVYLYGGLDSGPTELNRSYGMAWSVGGWLVFPFTLRIGPEATNRLKQRVAAELTTTFATSYARTIGLAEVLSPAAIQSYGSRATGEKVLVDPNRGNR